MTVIEARVGVVDKHDTRLDGLDQGVEALQKRAARHSDQMELLFQTRWSCVKDGDHDETIRQQAARITELETGRAAAEVRITELETARAADRERMGLLEGDVDRLSEQVQAQDTALRVVTEEQAVLRAGAREVRNSMQRACAPACEHHPRAHLPSDALLADPPGRQGPQEGPDALHARSPSRAAQRMQGVLGPFTHVRGQDGNGDRGARLLRRPVHTPP